MEENKTTRPPRQQNRNKTIPEEESKLGSNLTNIRKQFIKPYKELKTKEEKEEYKKQHPELEEVMAIIEEIDRNNPTKKKVKSTIIEQKNKGALSENYKIEMEFVNIIELAEKNIKEEEIEI